MESQDKNIKIGIVAGEQSGDQLGADLIQRIKAIDSSVEFVGVGGIHMIKQGLKSFFDMEKISVIGAGTMGNGIAQVFAMNNYQVNLIDLNSESLINGLNTNIKNYILYIRVCVLLV